MRRGTAVPYSARQCSLRLEDVASGSAAISRARAEGITETLRFMCCPPSRAGSHTHCSGSLTKPVKALTVPFAFQSPTSKRMTLGKLRETTRFTRRPEQTSRRALYGSRRFRAKWKPRNWLREASVSLSDTPQHLPRRVLPEKRLSLHGRSGRRTEAGRNPRNWSAATAGAMTWLRVSPGGAIADAASVLVSATDQRRGRGRRC